MMVQPFYVARRVWDLEVPRQPLLVRTLPRHSPAKDGECVCDSLATEYVGIFRDKKKHGRPKKRPNNDSPQLLF